MICSKCGKEISDNDTFCQFCGTKIRDNELNDGSKILNNSLQDGLHHNYENQEKAFNHSRERRSLITLIFDYKVYLVVVTILTIASLIIGWASNQWKKISEDSKITGELSRFIGESEESFLKDTGLSRNDAGFYPTMDDMIVYFDDGKVATILLNKSSNKNYDKCSLFGLKIGDVLEDVQDKLAQYEYVDTQESGMGAQNAKCDVYRVSSDNSMISVTYAKWDHAILSINYVGGICVEDGGITQEASGESEETYSAENVKKLEEAGELYKKTEENNTNSGYLIPYSSDTILSDTDLADFSAQELTYARNEIYARHGYLFKSRELNKYFNSQTWYIPNPSFDGTLYGVEKDNVLFIKNFQEKYGLQYKPQ
ncbi:YARHG domain-containing protein [[Clostridium] aminophilum]|uniref:Zinc-ribbon domain-containing protein n=1 Tax=[Clostridium] aminophilum TaxID=1526 RepID=A0A1I6IDM1_9FIRM|nr:YARHG domain-containing protein [[Clostridium] aminophilum]SFR64832.1 zinc-ribbon domain-containing protein [[Clostridium] aminophilum]